MSPRWGKATAVAPAQWATACAAIAFVLLSYSATSAAAAAPGLKQWCNFSASHQATTACQQSTACETADSWWSDAERCVLPGPVGTFPYSVSSYDVCGGPDAITRLPLRDDAGRQLGSVTLFRSWGSSLLRVSVALGGAGGDVVLYRQAQPQEGEGADSASLFLFNSLLPGAQPQYSVLVAPPDSDSAATPGLHSCFSLALNLSSLCHPLFGFQAGLDPSSGLPVCACYGGVSAADCRPRDLAAEPELYFSLKLNVSLLQPGAEGCGNASGAAVTTTISTRFPATGLASANATAGAGAGVGASSAAPSLGPVRTGCREPAPPPGTAAPSFPPLLPQPLVPPGSPPLAVGVYPPTYPPPPYLGAHEAALAVRSPLRQLSQAEQCSRAVMQLYPLYRGAAVRGEFRAGGGR
ncbi:hypothetical protein GPECTOR_10g755 [Gonium pectorale]|uniref:Pherophorin domain-containing protein n=1 Tax=Gonium pectorale TaxID=33097 RepID=A0A150GQI1_GONPE|nr:hypothetical protein GPECTOR_10g755 [Gonium pectorale]|eukprot:KXZ52126.1 hypothetical protein GPECTOR_10g755 [Gonium pectorale]